MRIAAVVVSHDSVAELEHCLEALLGQQPSQLVVVVDNASRDGSADLVERRFGDRVELLRSAANLGFAGGCNAGLEAVGRRADAIAFCNPDVVVGDGCLVAAGDALASDDGLAGVAPLLLRPGGERVDSAGQLLRPLTLEVHDRGYGRAPTTDLLTARPVLAACGALAVYRVDALVALAEHDGAWAGSYFCFWEDLELGWRAWNRGWRMASAPAAVAEHGRGAGAAAGRGPLRWRRSVALEAWIVCNRWRTLIRHLHPADLAVRLPAILARDGALLLASVARRPRLLGELRARLPLVMGEWQRRRGRPRRRLRELPC